MIVHIRAGMRILGAQDKTKRDEFELLGSVCVHVCARMFMRHPGQLGTHIVWVLMATIRQVLETNMF